MKNLIMILFVAITSFAFGNGTPTASPTNPGAISSKSTVSYLSGKRIGDLVIPKVDGTLTIRKNVLNNLTEKDRQSVVLNMVEINQSILTGEVEPFSINDQRLEGVLTAQALQEAYLSQASGSNCKGPCEGVICCCRKIFWIFCVKFCTC